MAEYIARQQMSVFFSFYDTWTQIQLISEPGMDWHLYLMDKDILEWSFWLNPMLYSIAIIFINFILGRICIILPIFYHIFMLYTSYNDGLNAGFAHALILALTTWNFCRKHSERRSDALMDRYSAVFTPNKGPILNWNLFMSLFILIGLSAVIALSPPNISSIMSSSLALAFILISSTFIPGVGGNSTAGVASLVIIALISLLSLPNLLTTVTNFLEASTKPQPSAPASISYSNMFYDWMTHRNPNDSLSFGIGLHSIPDVSRYMLGFVFTWVMFFDEFLGPGNLISGAADGLQTKAHKERMKHTAGFYNSPWVWTVVGNAAYQWVSSGIVGLCIASTAIIPGYLVHKYFASLVWNSRGQASTLTALRDNMLITFGSGIEGMRRFLANLTNVLAIMALSSRLSLNIIVFLFILQWLFSKNEKWLIIFQSALTYNLGTLVLGLANRSPLTQSIQETTINAYSPTMGSNASSNPDPQPTQHVHYTIPQMPAQPSVVSPPPPEPPNTFWERFSPFKS